MAKTQILDINGKKSKEIDMPVFLSSEIRNDLILKVLEAKKTIQPYGPNPMSGNSYSASGLLKHHRKVWKSQYGRGASRIPRKVMTRKGSQFNWVGATVPNTRGGRRAHPPKVISKLDSKKINKKEMKLALMSALSATANGNSISKKYSSLKNVEVKNIPFIVEAKITTLKAKELISSIKQILGENLFFLAIQKKTQRAGKGKVRGRKYKSNAGLLLVVGKEEKVKTTAFDVSSADTVGVSELAKGGPGRITIYTEQAINELKEKFK